DGTVGGDDSSVPTLSAAGLALFAVACPVCNKIVLVALGTSGALGVWAPLQPWLAMISLAALVGAVAYAARRRPASTAPAVWGVRRERAAHAPRGTTRGGGSA
ncbi:MAG TPA: hypothetical protein VJN29_07600, partial [Intrasporangium sp.]|nr:hypothetical protein [Intrasporangium sp.]